MIDILITTFNRVDFLKQTVENLIEKNVNTSYRLFIIDDCSDDGTDQYLLDLKRKKIADIYLSKGRRGVVFGFDMLWNVSNFFDFFFSENQYLCYLQDDLVSKENGWILTAIRAYEELKDKYNIGFFSGFDAPEHPIKRKVNWESKEVLIKKSTSATNLIGEKLFWRSIGYVPRLNPDGTERGFPNYQRGSHIDIYLTGMYSGAKFHRTHSAPSCAYNQGKNILVIPELLYHLGHAAKGSTWRTDEINVRT